MEDNYILNNQSNTKEEIFENMDIEENNSYRLSHFLNGNSYNEEIERKKRNSIFHESKDLKSGDDTTNSQILDEINSSMINFNEMHKICKDVSKILYKSTFNFKIKKENFEIKYGNNSKIDYNELLVKVDLYKKAKIELYENFSRLVKFLEKAKEEILKYFKKESKLEINLNLYTVQSNKNYKNIEYSYKFGKNDLENLILFKDIDILNNYEQKNLKEFISYVIQKIKIDKIEFEYKEKKDNSNNSNMFFTIISKNLDKSNEIIKLSHEIRVLEGILIKQLSIKGTKLNTNIHNLILQKIKDLEMEIDNNEIIKNINDIKNILEQTTVILYINDNEKDDKIILETKMNQNIEETNYYNFRKGLTKYDRHLFIKEFKVEYNKIKSLIEKYKDVILFIEDIKRRSKEKFPLDKFIIKLIITKSNICQYYIYDESPNPETNKKIYYDKNILTNKDHSGFASFLDDLMKKKIIGKAYQKKKQKNLKKMRIYRK